MAGSAVRIPFHPPLAAAVGAPFFVWLFGSLTWDELFGPTGSFPLAFLFGLVFLLLAAVTLSAWADLLHIRRIGLFLDESGVTDVRSGWVGLRRQQKPWSEIRSVSLEKDRLLFAGEGESLEIHSTGLLETPEWVIDRARRFMKGPVDRGLLEELAADVAPLSCSKCGGDVEVPFSETTDSICPYCGTEEPLPDGIRRAVARVRELVLGIPEAHRRLGQQTMLKFLRARLSLRLGIIRWSWVTAGIFLFLGIVGTVVPDRNWRFVIAMALVASTALILGYGVGLVLRKLSMAYSNVRSALPPLSAGGSARCRLCGADLVGSEPVRSCTYCDAESIVTGVTLDRVERGARQGLAEARRQLEQSTDASLSVLDRSASSLEMLALLQIFWLQIPLVVALDGYFGPLRLTLACAAIAVANLVAGGIGLRWLGSLSE